MRDPAGEKPLYLAGPFAYAGGDVWAFASTVPAIVRWARVAGVRLELDVSALTEWTSLGWSSRTPWTKIREIGPGETWIVGEAKPRKTVSLDSAVSDARAFESAADLDSAIAECVGARLEADVPLGCFLSGGVDSSMVALHARRALGSLRTFTVRMDDPRYDESLYAQQAATTIGSTHETIDVHPDPATDLPRLIEELGLPFGDSSLLPTHWVSRAAREFVPVALGGDGGDELFMGYDRHTLGWLSRWRWLASLLPITWLDRRNPKGWADKLARLVVACRGTGYQDLIAIFQSPELSRLLRPQEQTQRKTGGTESLNTIRLNDVRSYLPFDLLRKSDTASMSVALEVRSPLLDRSLAARALATPASILLRGGRKGLLREAARQHFDAPLIDRPKMGFAIPVGEWFRRDAGGLGTMLRDRLSSAGAFGEAGSLLQISTRECQRLTEEHNRGLRDHSQRLYMLLVMSIWAERFTGPRR
jgi:asparagine synthase (glutamine-hydrolysing)